MIHAPTNLNLKCSTNTESAKHVVQKARKDLVRERIRFVNDKLLLYKERKSELEEKLDQNLN